MNLALTLYLRGPLAMMKFLFRSEKEKREANRIDLAVAGIFHRLQISRGAESVSQPPTDDPRRLAGNPGAAEVGAMVAFVRDALADLGNSRAPVADSQIANMLECGVRFDEIARSQFGDDLRRSEFTSQLTCILLFHNSGILREAALNKVRGPLHSPLFVVGIFLRLNDWAIPVRSAALRCARRAFPITDPGILAAAVLSLILRAKHWRRWDSDAASILDAIFARPDVALHFANFFLSVRSGPASAILRQAMRWSDFDGRLEEIARSAFLPGVRALALKALLRGHTTWIAGWDWEWVDKIYNKRRRVPRLDSRPVSRTSSLEELFLLATADKSALVRKAGSEALLDQRAEAPNLARLAEIFAADRNRRVREPAEFILRELDKRT